MSRPNSSVPNQCAADGGINREGKLSVAGSWGASSGANIANITKTITITAPAVAKGRLRACSAVAEKEFELITDVAIAKTSYGITCCRRLTSLSGILLTVTHQQRNMFPLRRAVPLLFMMAFFAIPSRAPDDSPAADPAVEQSMFKL